MFLVLACLLGAVAGGPGPRNVQQVAVFKEFLENTVADNAVPLEERIRANPQASAWENSGKYQGDILLDDSSIQRMVTNYESGRNAYTWPNTKWPNNVIVYEFTTGFTSNQQQMIITAMQDIQRHTCIRFRQRQASDTIFVRITGRPDGCYAHVGYWASRGVHTFNLAPSCFLHTIIVHEWIHIIGFLHMQSTHDRDSYVAILWDNIQSGMQYNFDRYSSDIVSNLGLRYEYASSMHYGPYAFSSNGRPTIAPRYNDEGLMGQTRWITARDWLRVNRHYNCPGAWRTVLRSENFNDHGVQFQAWEIIL